MSYKQELQDLMETVVKEDGSDLHLAEGRSPVIRVGGTLISLLKQPALTKENMHGIVEEVLTTEAKSVFLKNKEADFAYDFKGQARFRGNIFIQQGRMGIALRLIPNKIRTLQELNLPPIIGTFAQRQQGFFLIVGPTGHGKSTTMAALIEMINNERTEHIITIEDPIEYVFKPNKSVIDQREVRIDTPDFYTALRGVFRQDVDVLMVGEMREPETISVAVTAAETGHLVFSTLHTNTAANTVERIIDSFPGNQQDQIRIQLAGSLAGILSQRLIPRISGGLIPAYELLINNSAVTNLIRENRVYEINTVIETSSELGMIDLNRSLVELVEKGEITVENAHLYSTNPKQLEKLL